jgi:protein-ribulosamine 3-kinase
MSMAVHSPLGTSMEGSSQIQGDFPVDENVLAQFPPGSHIVSADRFGTSAWTVTARLAVTLPDGTQQLYFLKCATEQRGRVMMEGEFNAMSEIYKTMPNFAPKPYSWGKYQLEKPETYFFLADFIDMSDRHQSSASPTEKFGFHVTTCQGSTPQAVGWETSWVVFFSKLLHHVLDLDVQTNGRWKDLDVLSNRIISEVIPRLIGALERDGRTVKPCLIHADLWEGNTGTSFETGDIYIFDSAAFYAHNEMEIGDWRCNYNKIHNKIYTRTYFRRFPPSEPHEEWDDRNRMYSVYYNTIYSVNHKRQGTAVRQM